MLALTSFAQACFSLKTGYCPKHNNAGPDILHGLYIYLVAEKIILCSRLRQAHCCNLIFIEPYVIYIHNKFLANEYTGVFRKILRSFHQISENRPADTRNIIQMNDFPVIQGHDSFRKRYLLYGSGKSMIFPSGFSFIWNEIYYIHLRIAFQALYQKAQPLVQLSLFRLAEFAMICGQASRFKNLSS